jgi:hypothetical protein
MPGIGEDQDELDALDRFLQGGALTLRTLANNTGEVLDPDDQRALKMAERAGTLAKVDAFYGEDMLIKTALPGELHELLTDPVEIMGDLVGMSRAYLDAATQIAEPLAKADLLPEDMSEIYPELFEPALDKAFPPKRKDPNATADGPTPPSAPPRPRAAAPDPGQTQAGDEDVGDGSDADPQDPGDAAGDDATQNPIEMMVRMASIIVVVGGSLLQAQNGGDQDSQGLGATTDSPMQRIVPIEDIPLAKIESGEIVVSDSLADALVERLTMRDSLAKAQQDLAAKTQAEQDLITSMAKMQETITRLSKTPVPLAKGAVFQPSKGGDAQPVPGVDQSERLAALEKLAGTNPEAAAKEMLKMVHARGGSPLVPPPPSLGA